MAVKGTSAAEASAKCNQMHSRERMDKLADAIRLANKDWRDLLVAAGFAESVDAHKDWKPVSFYV